MLRSCEFNNQINESRRHDHVDRARRGGKTYQRKALTMELRDVEEDVSESDYEDTKRTGQVPLVDWLRMGKACFACWTSTTHHKIGKEYNID